MFTPKHTWELLPLRLNDMDDQVSWADIVGQLLHAFKWESGLAIGQVCLEAAIVCGNSGTKGR